MYWYLENFRFPVFSGSTRFEMSWIRCLFQCFPVSMRMYVMYHVWCVCDVCMCGVWCVWCMYVWCVGWVMCPVWMCGVWCLNVWSVYVMSMCVTLNLYKCYINNKSTALHETHVQLNLKIIGCWLNFCAYRPVGGAALQYFSQIRVTVIYRNLSDVITLNLTCETLFMENYAYSLSFFNHATGNADMLFFYNEHYTCIPVLLNIKQ